MNMFIDLFFGAEGPVLEEDLDFAAALGGVISGTDSKKKKIAKKATSSTFISVTHLSIYVTINKMFVCLFRICRS